MSKWKIRTPARISASICSPSCAKSAAYRDGSISTVLIHSPQGIARRLVPSPALGDEPGDEESARAVDVRQREQELRPAGGPKLRPLPCQRRVDVQARRVDDILVLGTRDRAD